MHDYGSGFPTYEGLNLKRRSIHVQEDKAGPCAPAPPVHTIDHARHSRMTRKNLSLKIPKHGGCPRCETRRVPAGCYRSAWPWRYPTK